jgi:uncharacterized protein with GYD domain
MPTYVLLSRLEPEVLGDPRGREAVGKEWKKRVDDLCPEVRWIAHYALLGHYDFMDIYEAPGDEVAHQVSLISRETGALVAESWPAMPYDSFLEIAQRVEKKLHHKRR